GHHQRGCRPRCRPRPAHHLLHRSYARNCEGTGTGRSEQWKLKPRRAEFTKVTEFFGFVISGAQPCKAEICLPVNDAHYNADIVECFYNLLGGLRASVLRGFFSPRSLKCCNQKSANSSTAPTSFIFPRFSPTGLRPTRPSGLDSKPTMYSSAPA